MKFGPVPLEEAEGAILAHSAMADGPDGTRKIGKGTRLEASHIAALRKGGMREVIVARLDPDDVGEDAAAARLAQALAGKGLEVGAAATGRVNLRAEGPGIVDLKPDLINAVNRINPAITVATVPKWGRLPARGLAVTVKIIPFAVPEADVARACDAGRGAVRLRAPQVATASLIETEVAGEALSLKGRNATAERLERLSVRLTDRVVVPHRVEEIAQALATVPGEIVLILTGSATSDAADVAPSAVRAAGGSVLHYGMPVDPGNLLFFGRLGPRPVIGLPGCARSPALNGADWVMERIICGVSLDEIDIPGLGVGGLLKEIPSRPRPREG